MSGVFGQKFGRKNSATFVVVNSVSSSSRSAAVLRHVKYVYDCEKPIFASRYITLGRVKASARNSASGCRRLTSAMHHSQNGKAFVCGLSTRKIVTPSPIQYRKTSRSAVHRPCQSSDSKSNG